MKPFFQGLTGEVITLEDSFYNEARQEWNRAIQKFPLAIVYCTDKRDVANAVAWSRQRRVPVRIRSGGHNYEGFSTGDGVLVVDVSNLNRLKICGDHLYAEGGVKNRELYGFLGSRGYPFPSGTCPTVGVSGLVSGGGWGLSCRRFGLACDSMEGLELVDANGRIIKANSFENEDLFWACRGAGGGNFGVIVSLIFRLPPKTGKVTYFQLNYYNTDQEKQARFIEAWQEWLQDLDPKMSAQANVYRSQEDGFAIFCRGLFYGTEAEAKRLLQPISSLSGGILKLEYLSFLDAITEIGSIYPASEMFQSPGRFVLKPLTSREIYEIAGLIREVPPGSTYSSVNLYSLGGKVSEKSPADTAFFYRDARYIILIQSVWEDEKYTAVNRRWIRRRFPYFRSVTRGSYINFPYCGTSGYLEAYYGENAGRLRMVKRKYDPENVFRFPQSID